MTTQLFTQDEYESSSPSDALHFQCESCDKTFTRSKTQYENALKRDRSISYCSLQCNADARKSKPVTLTCGECGKIFTRATKIRKTKTGLHFCSKSCSASHTNRHYIRRKKLISMCIECGSPVLSRHKYCDRCLLDMRDREIGTMSAGTIRYHARVAMSGEAQICSACGYVKHVETCHRKPVSKFLSSDMLSVVNAKSNLVLLCPNCHWELDHPDV